MLEVILTVLGAVATLLAIIVSAIKIYEFIKKQQRAKGKSSPKNSA